MKRLHSYAVLTICVLAAACNESSFDPQRPASVSLIDNLPSTAAVGASVSPAVSVRDASGSPVAGVTVTFEVVAGGGTISSQTATTNQAGTATVSWTLGNEPGVNTLEATVAGLPPVTISITASTIQFNRFAGHSSSCPVGSRGCRFAVRATTAGGAPIAGRSVVWTGPGGATTTTVTNAEGIAVAPNVGTNSAIASHVQVARLESENAEVNFTFNLVQGGQYDIEIRYVGSISEAQRQAFTDAAIRWEQVIAGNLPSVNMNIAAGACKDPEGDALVDHPAINEVIDDLLVYVQVDSIDGPGGVLGSAGPCFIRSASRLPVFGVMRFDRADLQQIEQNGVLGDVILHELAHVLGFPSIWNDEAFRLLEGSASNNPYFTGRSGVSLFTLAGGTFINDIVGVPVENTGGEGTRDSHWREAILRTELMTGFVSSGSNPLSEITIGSLQDLGYVVDFSVADPYAVPAPQSQTWGWSSLMFEMIERPMPAPRVID